MGFRFRRAFGLLPGVRAVSPQLVVEIPRNLKWF
jgi:hypothetical protein